MIDRFSRNGTSGYKFLVFLARILGLDPKMHFYTKFDWFWALLLNLCGIWKYWRAFEKTDLLKKKNYTSAILEKSKICRIETDKNIFPLSFYAVDFWFFENCGRIIFFFTMWNLFLNSRIFAYVHQKNLPNCQIQGWFWFFFKEQ